MFDRPPLSAEEEAAFAALQKKLRGQWQAIATHSSDEQSVVVVPSLHFNQATETGVVFHMLAALSERGFVDLTAVADSPADARALFDRTVATLNQEPAPMREALGSP